MFGYEIADLLLFDFETLKEAYGNYLRVHKIPFYSGLIINLFLIYYIKRSFRTVYFFIGYSWIFSGYFFYIKQLQPIYWPSLYFGIAAIVAGTSLMILGLAGISMQFNPHKSQISFAAASLIPTLVTFVLAPKCTMALGTSATLAASSTLSLFLLQRGWMARTISLFSALWCLIIAISLWTLLFHGK